MSPVSGGFPQSALCAVCQTTQWNSRCPQPAHTGAQKPSVPHALKGC